MICRCCWKNRGLCSSSMNSYCSWCRYIFILGGLGGCICIAFLRWVSFVMVAGGGGFLFRSMSTYEFISRINVCINWNLNIITAISLILFYPKGQTKKQFHILQRLLLITKRSFQNNDFYHFDLILKKNKKYLNK